MSMRRHLAISLFVLVFMFQGCADNNVMVVSEANPPNIQPFVDLFMSLQRKNCTLSTGDRIEPAIELSNESWESAANVLVCNVFIQKQNFENMFEFCALSGVSFNRKFVVTDPNDQITSKQCGVRRVMKELNGYSFEISGQYLDSCSWVCKTRPSQPNKRFERDAPQAARPSS